MDWEWPEGTSLEREHQVAAVAWVLYEEGPFLSEEGRATGLLLAALKQKGVTMTQQNLNKILGEMEDGGRFGGLLARSQSESFKRTYEIIIAADPETEPFPPRPTGPAWRAESQTAPEAPEPEEPLTDADAIDDIPRLDTQPVPSTDIVPVSDADDDYTHDNPTQKLIFASSMIHEVIADLARATATNQAEQMGRMLTEQLTAANELLAEVNRLRDENSLLRRTNRDLQTAYDSLRSSLNGRVRA